MQSKQATAEARAAPHRPLAYSGTTADLQPIAAGVAARNLLTVYLYRFWGRTRVRRFLWSHTALYGEPLEYAGTGGELFTGFLKVAVLVVLPSLAYDAALDFWLGLDEGLSYELATVPCYAAFAYLVGQGAWRARRYRLDRTLWRGIRFGMAGSPHDYAMASVGYSALLVLSLGWAWPYMDWQLERRLWQGTRIGDRSFRVDGNADGLVAAFAPFWCLAVPAAGFLDTAFDTLLEAYEVDPAGTWEEADDLFRRALELGAIGGLLALAACISYAWYRARLAGRLAKGLRFGAVRFRFDVTAGEAVRLGLGNALIVWPTLGLGRPLAQQRTVRFVCRHLEASGEPDLASLRRGAAERDGGEGLADAFDMGAV